MARAVVDSRRRRDRMMTTSAIITAIGTAMATTITTIDR